jgi:YVTN family beta-propeller protein
MRRLVLIVGVALVAQAMLASQAFAAMGWTAYVADNNVGLVTPFTTATDTPGTAITVGQYPTAVAITPDGRTAYVSSYGAQSITPINTATGMAGTAIPIGGNPWGVAVTPDGKTAYVANASGDTLVPIDTATGATGTAIAVGEDPQAVAVTPDGKTVYVANYLGNSVTPINTATDTPETTIPTGANPSALAITPDGTTLYVANLGSETVTPINTATNTPETAIPVGEDPAALAITPDGKTLYVADEQGMSVTPINTATNTAETAIPVGGQPKALAVTPDGKTVYVTSDLINAATPISTATGTPGSEIPIGSNPSALAITPDQAPTASFTVAAGHPGQASNFDASASSSPVGSIVSYKWNFGDGQSATTTVPTVAHIYGSAGAFTAQLTVTNSAGTSLSQVFTGQTVSNQGGPQATSSHTVIVPPTVTVTPPTPTSPTPTSPRLTRLRISPRIASSLGRMVSGHCALPTPQNRGHRPCPRAISLHISYSLTAAAQVAFTLQRRGPGRIVNHRCVASNRHNRERTRCSRWIRIPGRFAQNGRPGADNLVFDGRINGHELGAGTYRLTATPATGAPKHRMFQIVD